MPSHPIIRSWGPPARVGRSGPTGCAIPGGSLLIAAMGGSSSPTSVKPRGRRLISSRMVGTTHGAVLRVQTDPRYAVLRHDLHMLGTATVYSVTPQYHVD